MAYGDVSCPMRGFIAVVPRRLRTETHAAADSRSVSC